MKVLITGGCGFLGQELARVLLRRRALTGPSGRQEEIDSLVLFDAFSGAGPRWEDTRRSVVLGDIADKETVFSLCERDDLAVFHMASLLSGGSEADLDGAWRVNVEGSRNVLEALRARSGRPRLVFLSSVAVFGGVFTKQAVGDLTKQNPQSTYGTTKAIVELLVNDYTRRGFVDGRVARLPTVIVRPGAPNAAASSFASSVVREPFAGVDVVAPVPLTTKIVVIGHRTAVAGLVALHELDGGRLGADRALDLPNIAVTADELVASLHRLAGDRALGQVTEGADPAVINIVSTWPTVMDFAAASVLGLPRDQDVDSLVASYIEDFGPES